MPFQNVQAWQRDVNRQANLTKQAIGFTVRALALHTVGQIQNRIPPGASNSAFPGYAATGTLKSLVRSTPVVQSGNTFRSRVYVDPHPRHPTIPLVHEYGMTIRARRAPYMVFQIGGKWVKAKQVRIRPKRFFSGGWAAAQSSLPGVLRREIASRVR